MPGIASKASWVQTGSCPNRWLLSPSGRPVVSSETSEESHPSPLSSTLFSSLCFEKFWNILISFLEGPFFFFFLDEEDEAATDLSSWILSLATFFSSGGGRKCDGVTSPVVVLVFWPYSVWTKSLMCKDAVNRDSTFQSIFRRLCTAKKIEDFRFPVSRSDDVSSHPDARQTSIIRPDDVSFRPDPPLYREASVLACIHLDVWTARPDAH